MAEDDFKAWLDQFNFSFPTSQSENEDEIVLPFRVLVVADFGSHNEGEDFTQEATSINVRSFDEVLKSQQVSLTFNVYDFDHMPPLLARTGIHSLNIDISALNDFKPEQLVKNESTLSRLYQLIQALKKYATHTDDLLSINEFTPEEWYWLGEETAADDNGVHKISKDALDFLITDLEADLNIVINRLLHHPRYQEVESAWRGLHLLTLSASIDAYCQVDLVSFAKESFYEDVCHASSLDESQFFEILYTNEYGQYGGKPYGAVIADFQFGIGDQDIELLTNVGRIAQAAHAPFIAALAPSFFGVNDYTGLANLSSIQELVRGRRYIKWRAFQAKPEAAYIVLTLPRILLRAAYRFEHGDVPSLVFQEDVSGGNSDSLWGNAAYGFGCCLIESFHRYQMCTDITGLTGGVVRNLPAMRDEETDEPIFPVEVLLSENKESELINIGLTPISVAKAADKVVFYSANSLRWGYFQLFTSIKNEPIGAKLGTQLPYLFIILRISHYLKVIYREYLGSLQSLPELRGKMLGWLKRYVSDVESPAPAVRARRPLKRVQLLEAKEDASGHYYEMKLEIIPHMKYGGQEYSLSVDLMMNRN